MNKQEQARPNCRKCRHFYITHEPEHPYGCRAMNFKTRQKPALVVKSSSGIECQMYAVKL